MAAPVSRTAVEAEARRRIDADDPESALEVLEDAGRTDTTDEAFLELRGEAESACFTQLFGEVLGPHRVPDVVRRPETCTPEESFLLSLVDGTDAERLVVPLRALVVVRSLKALVDSGAVVFGTPEVPAPRLDPGRPRSQVSSWPAKGC